MRKKERQVRGNEQLSRSLSWVLRHGAVQEGLKISPSGFVPVDDILQYFHHKAQQVTLEQIKEVVENNDKKRFELMEQGHILFIRATQGHSIKEVISEELLTKITDPEPYPVVVHGTFLKFWPLIKVGGLKRMTRNHIHFAPGMPKQQGVISGMRGACDVIIEIDLIKAMKDGIEFFISSNKVILTQGVNGVLAPQYFRRVTKRNGAVLAE